MKGYIFWDLALRSPVKVTDVSEEHIASIFKAKNKLGKKPG
jgi:hypothetical protein